MILSDFEDRISLWAEWYKHNYCKVLVENVQWLKSKRITSVSIFAQIVPHGGSWSVEDVSKIKRELQRYTLRAIKDAEAPRVVERIRNKVERWRGISYGLSGLPGHYSNRMARRIIHLATLVTPRVHAAVFKTLWNGWCTHRRFQRRHWASNICFFKCGDSCSISTSCSSSRGAEDSLEHYCRCPVVLRVANHLFHFSYPEEMGLDLWALNSAWLDTPANMRGLALLVYGVYMAFNSIRYNKISDSAQAFHCIVQHCKQGAMGHAPSMAHMEACWRSPMSYIL